MFDYGARFYDPVIGRWNVVDKLAEHPNQIDKSPYAYAWNNPVKLTDPDGNCPMCPIIYMGLRYVVVTALAGTATYIVVNGAKQLSKNGGYYNSVQDEGFTRYQVKPQSIVKSEDGSSPDKVKSPPNPDGSKGKPDHQGKVAELVKEAQSEAKPGEQVLSEKKIQGQESRRRPDVQIVDKDGKARKVFEAERKPNSQRNIKREEEYKKLGIEQETHKVGN